MKIKLLLCLMIASTVGFAQHQVNSFYSTNGFTPTAGTFATPPAQGSGGTNQSWTFNGFTVAGTSTITNATPSSTETTTYPGTTNVIVTTSGTTEGRMFTKDAGATVSITGLTSSGMTINCNGGTSGSGNATLGAFPMVYPFTNTDNNVSGSFNYSTYSGTFSGTLTTTVDAWGVLSLPNYTYTANVTRLKTILSVTLYASVFPIGTASQTTYTYYDPLDTTNNFAFRSLNTIVQSSVAGIDQNDTTYEVGIAPLLANSNVALQSLWIKNPVQNTIEINSTNPIEAASIRVMDMLGKTVYESKNQNINGTLELPAVLTKGVYLISIENGNGKITRKIVKS
ncbi:MAG: T9SS type A sorting domain-containing protein [Flavobacterium sp.]